MKFKCEKCGTRYTIAEEKVRHRVLKIRCKVCEHVITVRDPDAAGTPAPRTESVVQRRPQTSLAPTPVGGDFPSDRTSVSDPLAPVADVEWYAAPEGGQVGPMPLERLRDMIRQGEVKADDYVWNETLTDWLAAKAVPALGDLFRPKPHKPPPLPPPVAAPPAPPPAPRVEPASAHLPLPGEARRRETGTGLPALRMSGMFDAMVLEPERPDVTAPASRPTDDRSVEHSQIPERLDLAQETQTREAETTPEPDRAGLDVDLLSLLGPASGPTEVMPSSRSPTRPVESDELASLMAAEMAAPATVPSRALAPQLSEAPTRARPSGSHARVAKRDDHFGFGDLHDQPTFAPVTESGAHIAHPAPPHIKGPPWGLFVAAGLLLVVGGVGLGIWLAPQAGGPAVAAPLTPPSAQAAAPTVAPSAAPSAPEPESMAAAAPSAASSGGGGEGGEPERPHARTGHSSPAAPTAPAAPSRASAFAGLDAARGTSSAPVAPKVDTKPVDLPPGLDQAEITGVIKRNLKAVQGCYQRQLKRDDTIGGGRATIRFRILSDGHARGVDMERKFDGTILKQCIVTVVERWAFPPFSGDPIPVEFPVIFATTL